MFDKKKFKILLEKALGDRSKTEYANASGVNRTYISKLLNEKLDNPPTPDIIKRLSNVAHNGITYEQLMKAAGYLDETIDLQPPANYPHKITSRDKKQYLEYIKSINETFFMNDEFDEEDKKAILDTMNEIFWIAKTQRKKKKDK